MVPSVQVRWWLALFYCALSYATAAQSWQKVKAKADSCEAINQFASAYTLYKTALAGAIQELGNGHRNCGEILYHIGGIQSLLGKGKAAEDTLLLALHTLQQTGPQPDTLVGDSYQLLALNYRRQNQFAKAEEVYKRTLDYWDTMLGKTSNRYTYTLMALANVYRVWEKRDKALPLLLSAINTRRQNHDVTSPEYGTMLNGLATTYLDLDQFDQAEPLFLESLALQRKARSPSTAFVANNLGILYEQMGESARALALHLEAQAIWRNQQPGSAEQATSLQNIALCYDHMGQPAQADSLYTLALAIYAKSPGKQSMNYANTLNNQAGLRARQGRVTEAISMNKAAQEIVAALAGRKNPLYARFLSLHGENEQKIGNYPLADSLFAKALFIVDSLNGPTTVDHALYITNRAIGWYKMGQLNNATQGLDDGVAIQKQRMLRNFLYITPSQKEAYLTRWNTTAPLYYTVSQQYPANAHLAGESYTFNLFLKNMLLNEHSQLIAQLRESTDTLTISRLDTVQQLTKLITQQYNLPLAKRTNVDSLETRAEVLEKALARQSAPFRVAQQALHITWQDVQRALKPNEATVEFVHFQYHNGQKITDSTRYMALVLRPGWAAPRLVPLTHEKALAALLAKPSLSLTAALLPLRARQQTLTNTGQLTQGEALYQLIWQPLDSLLRGVQQVWVAPSGLLHKIALAALPYPGPQPRVLADRYTLRQISTTRALMTATPTRWTKTSRARLYGGITYATDTTGRAEWSTLPGTLREVQAISKVLGSSATVVTGQQATKMYVTNQPAANVLHLATHGFFQSPDSSRTDFVRSAAERTLRRSGIVLAGANRPSGADNGILSGQELANLNLNGTDLVVLSGCDTGLGDIRGSEGVFGLQRAVKMAGARNLMMSLWPVPDGPASQFMTTFYMSWHAGKPLHEAFAQTQQQFRKTYPPAVWAAFVLVE